VTILPELLTITELKEGQTIPIDQLYFESDSVNFGEASLPVLKEVHNFLVKNPDVRIEIGGHTNSLPADDYCDWLSTSRAESVAVYFYNKGISNERLSYKGYGKRVPIAPNNTKSGRMKNQRVEIKLLKIRGG
jgi:outer membrane protein OmpA-like peptidoglycan-associated protein